MKDFEFVDYFMTHVMSIMNHLCTDREGIQDQKVIKKILCSLPDKFNMVVVSL
jgi:hypothetical protein